MSMSQIAVWGIDYLPKILVDIVGEKGLKIDSVESEETVKNHDVIFFFQESNLTTEGLFDTTKLYEMVEMWGYCFENGISVENKTFILCCDLNPGDTKKIHEILNPMNINVCYLPIHNTNLIPPRIPVGTLNPVVVSQVSDLLNKTFFQSVHVFSMTSLSVEILNLGLSQSKLSKNLSLINYRNTLIQSSISEEYSIFESFLDYKPQIEYKEDILRNEVLSKFIDLQRLPNNVSQRVMEERQKNTEFVVQTFLKSETPKSTRVILDGLCYSNSVLVDYNKYQVVKELVGLGYEIIVLETENFIRGKTPLEILNDLGQTVKFYKKGSEVQGYVLPL